jgi:hypothetical protein
MNIRSISILAALIALPACHDGVNAGQAGSPTPVSPGQVAVCEAAVTDIVLDANLAAPILLVQVKTEPVVDTDIEVLEDGAPVASWRGRLGTVDARFGPTYSVRARASTSCTWSPWFEKVIYPNPAGEKPIPVPPPAPPAPACTGPWTADFSNDAFGPGTVHSRPVNIPAGRYRVEVVTMDHQHGPGYQLGQAELVSVEWVGLTDDIGDLETSHTTVFEATLPTTSSIKVTGVSGSVHGVRVTVTCLTN